MSLTNYKAPLLFPQSSSPNNKNKKYKKIQKEEKDLKKTLSFSSQMPPLCCSAGVFIGDIRRRVSVQLFHEIALPA